MDDWVADRKYLNKHSLSVIINLKLLYMQFRSFNFDSINFDNKIKYKEKVKAPKM